MKIKKYTFIIIVGVTCELLSSFDVVQSIYYLLKYFMQN